MDYLIAVDQGTSSTRVMLYTPQGKLITSSQYLITQYYPNTGWVEHDPEEIWIKTLQALRDVAGKIENQHIIACGITNQRETTLIWDKHTGKCLSPAIVWQDRRTQGYCQSLVSHQELIHSKTGLYPDPYFSATKLRWLLDNIPNARHYADKGRLAFGTIDSFLIWRLTGGKHHLTDITNASRTMLFNIFDQCWDKELLNLFDIPQSILPEVKDCDSHFGFIEDNLIQRSIPITGVAGDQQAALIGQRCFKDGMLKATFGTGGFLLLNTGNKPILSNHKLLTTVAYRVKGEIAYGLEGNIYQAGTIVKWLRDEMKLFNTSSDTELLAKGLDGNGGVYLIPSFTGLGAPHWLETKGAVITGLACTSTPAHFARAALECVGYQTRDILACMQEDIQHELSLMRVDGGMAANEWFLQFLASQCNIFVQRPYDIETTVLGAAILAGIGCGHIDLPQLKNDNLNYEKEFIPTNHDKNRDADYRGWQNALNLVKSS